MKKSKFISLAALLIVLSLMMSLFAGCAPAEEAPASDATATEESTDTAEQTDEPAEKVDLRFMDIIPNEARGAQFQAMVEAYNAQSDVATVTFESTPWDTAHEKLVTQGSTGDLPDVFIKHNSWMSEFVQAGWVVDLADYYDNSFEYKDSFIPYVSDVLIEYDQRETWGGIYGLPDGLTTHGMFVRTDWIEEAGYTVEDIDTWDDLFEVAEAINDPSNDKYAFAYRGGRGGGDQMGMYVMSELGGYVYDEEGNCLFNTEEGIAAIERYTDIFMNNMTPEDSINWAYAEMVQGFTSGLSGILNQTTEVVATCNDSMEDGTWTVIPFPRSSDGNIYSKADSFLLSMGSNTEYQDQAFDFMSYMLTPEVNLEYCKVNLYIPVMVGAENDPYFNEGAMKGFVDSINDPNFVRNSFYGYFPENGEFLESYYDSQIQSYLLGQQSVEDLANNISSFLTENQQNFMVESPDTPLPAPVFLAQ